MQRACAFAISKGGVMKANLITMIWLALFGEFDWRGIPIIPPEIVFLPSWFYFNIYEFSSWARATIIALAVLSTEKPVCPILEYAHIPELYTEPEKEIKYSIEKSPRVFSWESFFLTAESLLKVYENIPFKHLRK